MDARKSLIEAAYEDRSRLPEAADAVRSVIADLDIGQLRVAEEQEEDWVVNTWVKQAILLYFGIAEMEVMEAGPFEYFDKIPPKRNLKEQAFVSFLRATRYGSYLEPGTILMPGYVNIGARVGRGTMVDTWATLGSCAQIGRDVHLAGGVGIGGVLEPAGATPVIIEDGAFIGSRCIVVEGVRVGREAVLGANVVLTASTPIIDVTGPEERTLKGMYHRGPWWYRSPSEGIPSRHLSLALRTDHWPAQGKYRPKDLFE